MSTAARRLVQTASEIVGGDEKLAEFLGIGEALLGKFISGRLAMPDALLLRAVDIVLQDRETHLPQMHSLEPKTAKGPA